MAFPGHFKHTGHTPTNVKSRFLINFVFFGNFHPDLMGQTADFQTSLGHQEINKIYTVV